MLHPLDTLKTGQIGIIAKNQAPHPLKSRLLSMGFLRGSQIEVLAHAIIGSTVMVRLNHHHSFSLRNEEAHYIFLTTEHHVPH